MAASGNELHTGQRAPESGVYEYVRPLDHSACQPTPEERRIPLTRGEAFPPHRSGGAAVVWRLVERT